jgi:hypothetical protein
MEMLYKRRSQTHGSKMEQLQKKCYYQTYNVMQQIHVEQIPFMELSNKLEKRNEQAVLVICKH